MMRIVLFAFYPCVAAVLSGCAFYQVHTPLALDPVVLAEATAPERQPDLAAAAGRVAHPLVGTTRVTFDDGLSPDEAAIVAIVANPELRVLRHELGFARAQLIEAWTLPNPEAMAEFAFPVGAGTEDRVAEFSIGAEWEITSLVPLWANIAAARRHDAAVALQIAWQEWLVAQKARQQAYRVAAVRDQIAAVRAVEHGLQDALVSMKEAVAAGSRTDIDLATAEATWLRAYTARLDVEQELEAASLAFNHMLGAPTSSAVTVASEVSFPRVPSNLLVAVSSLIHGLETNRLDLQAMQMEFDSQDERYQAALLGQVPRTSVGFFGGRDDEKIGNIGLAVSMDIPLFDRNQAQVQREKTARAQLRDEYHARVGAARAELMRLASSVQALERNIGALQQTAATHQRLVNNYGLAFEKQAVDVFAFFESRIQAAEIQRDLHTSKADLAAALIDLETASGAMLCTSTTTMENQP